MRARGCAGVRVGEHELALEPTLELYLRLPRGALRAAGRVANQEEERKN